MVIVEVENSAKKCSKNWVESLENMVRVVREGVEGNNQWYLDYVCLTHVMRRKYWFVKINRDLKNKVKFMDDSALAVDGICDVSIKRKNGKHYLFKYVLFIPGIKCILLRIG